MGNQDFTGQQLMDPAALEQYQQNALTNRARGEDESKRQLADVLQIQNQQLRNTAYQHPQYQNLYNQFGNLGQQQFSPFNAQAATFNQPTINTAQSDAASQQLAGVTGQQQAFANQLQQQSQGQGPSLAAQQMKQMQDRNIQQSMAMAASQRGVNPMMANRNAMMLNANNAQNIAGQTAQARIQEQLNAQNMYGQQLGTMQSAGLQNQQNLFGQALQGAQLAQQGGIAQAGLQQQTALANQQAQMGQQQFGANYQAQMLQQQSALAEQERQAQMARQAATQQEMMAAMTQQGYGQAPEESFGQKNAGAIIGGISNMASSVLGKK